jgi:hypothetical protein
MKNDLIHRQNHMVGRIFVSFSWRYSKTHAFRMLADLKLFVWKKWMWMYSFMGSNIIELIGCELNITSETKFKAIY